MINIGPLTLARRGTVALKAAPAQTGEKGAPTMVRRFGRRGTALIESEVDYLAAMQPPTRWATIPKMLADDAVGAAMRAVTLPILAAPLTVEPGARSGAGAEMAAMLQADLDGLTGGLHKHRREALGYLADGVRVFEKVFEVREDGLLHLRKLGLRPNGSIIEWMVDEHGGPVGVVQLDLNGREVELEIARLLILTNEGEGANMVGRSIFRSAYKAWWYKDKLERVVYIAAERGAVGIPVGTQVGDDTEVADAIEGILQGIRAHEAGFVRENELFKFRIEGLTGDRVDALPILQDFRRGVFVSVLADFLALGDGSAGSWALSRDKSSFFVMALRAIIEDLEATYNRYLVTPWVRNNWGDVPTEELPRITHGPLNTRNVGEWFQALTGAVEKGVLYPEPQMQRMAREILELPEEPATQPSRPQTADDRAAQQPNEPGDKPAALPGVNVQQAAAEAPRLESLVKIEALGIAVRFKEIEGTLDRGEAKMVEKLTRLQQKQAKRLAARGGKIVRSEAWDQLAEERIPAEEEAAAIEEELLGLYEFGQEEYGRELTSQGVKPERVEEEAGLKSKAIIGAFALFAGARLADRMLNAWGAELLSSGRAGAFDQGALAEALAGGVGKLLAELARQGASLAFGQGRGDMAQANASQIEWEIYSTMLDSGVCDVCAKYEGQGLAVDEPPKTPNPNCLGGARCRCVRIAKARQTEENISRSEAWRRSHPVHQARQP